MSLTKQNIKNALVSLRTKEDYKIEERFEIYGYLEAALQGFGVISAFPDDDNYTNNLYKEIRIKHLLWKDE